MLPATKAIPKELLPIYDRPLIERVVKEAIEGGIREIILVTRSGKEAIKNHFDSNYELEHRLVKKGKDKIFEDIVKIIPDDVKISWIRQIYALIYFLFLEGLNGFKTDADVYDCGNKLGFLSANLAIGMRDSKSREAIYALFNKLINDDI